MAEAKWAKFLPEPNREVCAENLNMFFRSMAERHLIWKRRFVEKKPQPWTNDPVFRQYKFTNVYRELDRSSQALIKNIILDTSLDFENLVWKTLTYRLFNNPETFRLFSYIWPNGIPDYNAFEKEMPKFSDALTCLRLSGARPFTNAYFISQKTGTAGAREQYYAEEVLPELHARIQTICNLSVTAENPSEFIRVLKDIPRIADFIAFELYRDLIYINKFTSHTAVPFSTGDWVNVGPGSSFGAALIFPQLKTNADIRESFYRLLAEVPSRMASISAEMGEEMLYPEWSKEERRYHVSSICNFTIDHIEHWLCEFGKYWRCSVGCSPQMKLNPVSDNLLYNI